MLLGFRNSVVLFLALQSTYGLITITNKLTKQVAFSVTNHDFIPYNSSPAKSKTYVVLAEPPEACGMVKPPPDLSAVYDRRDSKASDEPNWALFVSSSRGCGIHDKIITAQRFNYSGIILQQGSSYFDSNLPGLLRSHPNLGYYINVSFISEEDGNVLSQSYVFQKKKLVYTIKIVEDPTWLDLAQKFASDCFDVLIGIGKAAVKKTGLLSKNVGNYLTAAAILSSPLFYLYLNCQPRAPQTEFRWSGFVPPPRAGRNRPDGGHGSYGTGGTRMSSDEETDTDKRNNKADIYTCLQRLELKRGATVDEVKKSYHRLARLYHSDKTGGQAEEIRKQKEEKFKEINEAKTILMAVLQNRRNI